MHPSNSYIVDQLVLEPPRIRSAPEVVGAIAIERLECDVDGASRPQGALGPTRTDAALNTPQLIDNALHEWLVQMVWVGHDERFLAAVGQRQLDIVAAKHWIAVKMMQSLVSIRKPT